MLLNCIFFQTHKTGSLNNFQEQLLSVSEITRGATQKLFPKR